jgi:hypothetical protein
MVEGREVTVGAALLDRQRGDSFSFRVGLSGKILNVE